MARNRIEEDAPDHDEASTRFKRYRFEFGPGQIILYSLAFILVFSWIFAFGVLVGRGVPLGKSDDPTYKARLLAFLGLDKEQPPPPTNAAETWATPKKMLESLNYYEDLAPKSSQVPHPLVPEKSGAPDKNSASDKKTAAAQAQPQNQTSNPNSVSPVAPPASVPKGQAPEAPKTVAKAVPPAPQPPAPSDSQDDGPPPNRMPASGSSARTSEHYTVLVASMKEMENAQKLLDQLKSKGYSPRTEDLELSGSGKWKRILVGSFGTREEAMKFAAEINRKERMEGLVIKESN